jgi:hypothetical protein
MRLIAFLVLGLGCVSATFAEPPSLEPLSQDFDKSVRPFLESHCLDCHGRDVQEAKLDLSPFTSLDKVRGDLGHWELVLERLKAGEMPPEDAPKIPTRKQREKIVKWIEDLRSYEANKNAGDPGPVLPRRLNNTEYDNTIRDLTGVDLRPTKEFPVDPANPAGFANSGESLSMSPALFSKYLAAARHVADHLVLMPAGFDFAPHPAVIYSDKDKFAVRRIIDFYQAQKTDYAEFFWAAWLYKHRKARGEKHLTLAEAAASRGISAKYLSKLWELLEDSKNHHGPIAELREQWQTLPAPREDSDKLPLAECRAIRDWILQERKQREFEFPLVMIRQLNPSTQPAILWKNRLIAEHRRKGTMTDEEKQDENLRRAIERFCDVFPDRFMLTERGRMNLPFEEQNKGRLLNAGFHLQIGYYRDDGPLYDMLLTEEEKDRLDRMWHDLFFVTDVPVRQFQDYIYFERAEGREVITEAEFDFARGEDRSVTSPESMKKFARLYVEAVRNRRLKEEAIQEIARYFVEQSKLIQKYERARAEAEPIHLQALLEFAGKAWRRPLSADETRELLQFYRSLREDSELGHEEAIRDIVASILVSPFFSYRVDFQESAEGDGRLSSFSIANRLSYFLWSSMPDAELLRLAESDELQKPEVLRKQARRMLKDDRARALAVEFAGNWLDYRQFRDHVGVDRTKFTEFTDGLRESMFLEPVYFIHDLIRRDGSIQEFLEARHTFIDKNLAKHYQIPYSPEKADGDGWMRVEEAQVHGRGGLLPMAVFLTKSSPGLRTSPVKRGYWVVKNVLGEKIPAPPPNVPELPENEADLGNLTLREVLEKHREVKSCATCHAKFDFAGLVFESYGPIGQRRSEDLGGNPIDDRTLFPDGKEGKGLAGLKEYLLKHRREQFEDNLCRKLLAYGLGRSLLLSDELLIEEMKQTLAEREGRFSTLVEVIVASPQFLKQRPQESIDERLD